MERHRRVGGDLTLGSASQQDLTLGLTARWDSGLGGVPQPDSGESHGMVGSGVPGLAQFPTGLDLTRFHTLGH